MVLTSRPDAVHSDENGVGKRDAAMHGEKSNRRGVRLGIEDCKVSDSVKEAVCPVAVVKDRRSLTDGHRASSRDRIRAGELGHQPFGFVGIVGRSHAPVMHDDERTAPGGFPLLVRVERLRRDAEQDPAQAIALRELVEEYEVGFVAPQQRWERSSCVSLRVVEPQHSLLGHAPRYRPLRPKVAWNPPAPSIFCLGPRGRCERRLHRRMLAGMSRRGPTSSRGPRSTRGDAGEAVRLKPADPFDLIRWLARSQGDPRKAIAELVQNSLDANAKHVTIERRRIGGVPSIIVTDDGDGVLPDMERDEALRHLAQHIGHSRKAKLTPLERRERVIAGKYGVGLLGFWAIGKRFELRSRVNESKILALCLVEDEPGGRIVEMPLRTDSQATFTAAVVLDVHETALRSLSGARLASYLGSELRGQLLTREVEVIVQDGMARGLAQQRFEVRPRRFLGERLDIPVEIAVAGYAPMRVELYLARGDSSAAVQIACAGTVVAESVAEIEGLDLPREPWMGRELTGVIDFPELNVPPGARRGIAPDAAAFAFVEALGALAPTVERELLRYARERERAAHRDLAKELRRALRGIGKRLPQYELPDIAARTRGSASSALDDAARESGARAVEAPVIQPSEPGSRVSNDVDIDERPGNRSTRPRRRSSSRQGPSSWCVSCRARSRSILVASVASVPKAVTKTAASYAARSRIVGPSRDRR